MKNKKGFTLTEILLAVMIVGIIGIALAALTRASVRESGVGRSRIMLRNQLSTALRQLRQDVHSASGVTVSNGNKTLTLSYNSNYVLGPDEPTHTTVTYTFANGAITRNGDPWLSYVKEVSAGGKSSPSFQLVDGADGTFNSILRVLIVVEINSEPVINDVIVEEILLPHGISITYN